VLAVEAVEDGEAGPQPGGLALLLEDVQSQGVEGGDAQAAAVPAAEQFAHARLHLARRLVGEGDGGDVAGRHAGLLHQPGDLARDDAGLSRAGAGQHQQRAVEPGHGFALSWIEVVHGL